MKIAVMTEDEQILTLEVDPNASVVHLMSLLEIESRVPLQQQLLLYNGKETRNNETLSGLGIADEDLVMMVSKPASSQEAFNPDGSAANPAAFQQQIRNNADVMAQLFQNDPELAQVILGNDLNKLQIVLRARHKQEEERVMLYVDMEVNGVPIKAFVDSSRLTTISKTCAERLGLLRLLDERYKGIAHGVGQSDILGLIHVAPVKIGNNFYACSIFVVDSPNMEFLFGLDMLRKHECTIDLKDNVLIVGGGEVTVPFLQEKDISLIFDEETSEIDRLTHQISRIIYTAEEVIAISKEAIVISRRACYLGLSTLILVLALVLMVALKFVFRGEL